MLTFRSDDDRNNPPPGVTVNTSALSRVELGFPPFFAGRLRNTSLLTRTTPSDGSISGEAEGLVGAGFLCPSRARDLCAATRLRSVLTVPSSLKLRLAEQRTVQLGFTINSLERSHRHSGYSCSVTKVK